MAEDQDEPLCDDEEEELTELEKAPVVQPPATIQRPKVPGSTSSINAQVEKMKAEMARKERERTQLELRAQQERERPALPVLSDIPEHSDYQLQMSIPRIYVTILQMHTHRSARQSCAYIIKLCARALSSGAITIEQLKAASPSE